MSIPTPTDVRNRIIKDREQLKRDAQVFVDTKIVPALNKTDKPQITIDCGDIPDIMFDEIVHIMKNAGWKVIKTSHQDRGDSWYNLDITPISVIPA